MSTVREEVQRAQDSIMEAIRALHRATDTVCEGYGDYKSTYIDRLSMKEIELRGIWKDID